MAGVRRTWDKEAYEAKAKLRAEQGDDAVSEQKEKKIVALDEQVKEEFQPANKDSAGPMGSERAYLKARESRIDLDSKVGKTQIVTSSETEGTSAPGWWCEVCNCLLKDSTSYLDHINGKKHQRNLGYSMRVERAGVDQVKNRLALLKRKIADQASTPRSSATEEYEARLAVQRAEEELRKKKKKEELCARKKEKEIAELESADPEIAELMGFAGFGSSKK